LIVFNEFVKAPFRKWSRLSNTLAVSVFPGTLTFEMIKNIIDHVSVVVLSISESVESLRFLKSVKILH